MNVSVWPVDIKISAGLIKCELRGYRWAGGIYDHIHLALNRLLSLIPCQVIDTMRAFGECSSVTYPWEGSDYPAVPVIDNVCLKRRVIDRNHKFLQPAFGISGVYDHAGKIRIHENLTSRNIR